MNKIYVYGIDDVKTEPEKVIIEDSHDGLFITEKHIRPINSVNTRPVMTKEQMEIAKQREAIRKKIFDFS